MLILDNMNVKALAITLKNLFKLMNLVLNIDVLLHKIVIHIISENMLQICLLTVLVIVQQINYIIEIMKFNIQILVIIRNTVVPIVK